MSFGFLGDPNGEQPFDPRAMFNQMGRIFSSLGTDEGPVPPSLVTSTALEGVESDRSTMTRAELDDAFRLADLWLDEVTSLPATSTTVLGWTRREWVEASVPMWIDAVTPIANRMSQTMSEAVGQFGGEAEQLGLGFAQVQPLIEKIGGAMFATQLGQALARLASEVVGSTDIGIAVAPAGTRVLVPANVDAWIKDLDIERQQALLFLALREAAAVRLFSEHPWLRDHVISAIHDYARGITIDIQAMQQQAERAMEQLQGTDPESLAEIAQVFELDESPQQQAALRRLETILALIEGWIDHVVSRASSERLTEFAALSETVRRRRAAGGPAEAMFATLVGLQLRPRRLRDAANLWAALEHALGGDGRDDVWNHPDALPRESDLDDPLGYVDAHRLMREIPDDLSSLGE